MNKSKFFFRARRDIDLLVLTMAVLPGWCAGATSAVSGFSEQPNITTEQADDSGVGGLVGLGGEAGELLLDGFTFNTALRGTYNSNIDQKAAEPGRPERDDFIMALRGRIDYLSKSSDWTFGGNYKGSYDQYLSHSEFSGYDQSGGAVVNYEGGRISGRFEGGITYNEGTNRDYNSDVVQLINYSARFSGRYQMSPKTTIQGDIEQDYNTTLDDDYGDTESFNASASALWKYSPLTEFGPGVRYTYRTGSTQTGRSAIGPTLNLNYKLSTKVSLTSRAGVEFASYEDGQDTDPSFTTSIGVKYKASKLWGMNLTLKRDTQADPSVEGAFSENTSLAMNYTRKLRRATLGLGIGYSSNQREFSDSTSGATGDNRDYISLKSSLGMLIFSETTNASIFLQYSEQSSDRTDSWDSIQTGISLSRNF